VNEILYFFMLIFFVCFSASPMYCAKSGGLLRGRVGETADPPQTAHSAVATALRVGSDGFYNIVLLLLVDDSSRWAFAEFHLRADLLKTCVKRCNLFLQFINFAVFLEEFVEQHRVHRVIADGVWFSFVIW